MTHASPSIVVDMERIFTAINEERKAGGLPLIEHAVMRVRMNIRLAIKGIERIEGKLPVVLPADTAAELAQVLNGLFQVSLQVDRLKALSSEAAENVPQTAESTASSAMPAAETSASTATSSASQEPKDVPPPITTDSLDKSGQEELKDIYLVDLYVAINQGRRAAQLPPIEPAVIASRLGIRFSIIRRRRLDFDQQTIELSALDRDALQSILADQFDVHLSGGVHELLVAALRHHQDKPRKLSWLERVFRKRKHRISVPSLIMAIMRQRASLGYKPISPNQINQGCVARLEEMDIKLPPDASELVLSEAQLDQLAEHLRNEYGLYFEDFESFIDLEK